MPIMCCHCSRVVRMRAARIPAHTLQKEIISNCISKSSLACDGISYGKETIVTPDTAVRIVVITTPERLEQEWINRLAHEGEFGRVERVGVLSAAMELVQQTRPDLIIVDRDLAQTEACIRQIFTTLAATSCIAIVTQ